MLPIIFTTVTLAFTVSASKLLVSSYTGNITTLDLTESKGIHSLAQIQVSQACAPNASWLHLDAKHEFLYCLEEDIIGANGSLHSFKVDKNSGALTHVKNLTIPAAPVHATIYTSPSDGGGQLLAVAHYAWALTTYKLRPEGDFEAFEKFNFTMDKPGPDAGRQAAPHPHQVLVDRSNNYFVIPDLGADMLRIFHIDPKTLAIHEQKSFQLPPGSGPRHGYFLRTESDHHKKKNATVPENVQRDFYYLVTELSNDLIGYAVRDGAKGLEFQQIGSSKTYGTNDSPVFKGNAASEVIATHDHSLLVSNRNAGAFEINNPDPKNSTKILSDTLAVFSLDCKDRGTFKYENISPAGGSFPRHFSLNKDENLVAVGLQNDGRVAIYERSTETGNLNYWMLAHFEGLGGVTSIVWLE